MTENKTSESSSTKKRERQPISVPFIWEERPGVPKKDWKPTPRSPPSPPAPLPVKLIASVPFEWEEKPGKPLPVFLQPPPLPPEEEIDSFMFPRNYDDTDDDGFKTDDSFSSATSSSLLANGLIPTIRISNAVPVMQNSLLDIYGGNQDCPDASEAGSSTSSYATGTTSLDGASFLEWLFPLLKPRSSSFLEKAGCSEIYSPPTPRTRNNEFNHEGSIILRKPMTLGELIMMSRRRSIQRKTTQISKQDFSMELVKKNPFGCCILGISSNIGEMHVKWRRQLQLKLL